VLLIPVWSEKMTVPAGTPDAGPGFATVAVNVTLVPAATELLDVARLVEVGSSLTVDGVPMPISTVTEFPGAVL
jgi:hypothetical protein